MLIRTLVAGVALAIAAGCASAQNTVVYHIADSQTQALAGLRNLRNHLDADPTAKITVIAIAQGRRCCPTDLSHRSAMRNHAAGVVPRSRWPAAACS